MNESILIVLIGSGSTILGVIIGAVLTYIFSNKAETKEKKRKLLRNVHFTCFTEIVRCYTSENAFRKEHDINKGINLIDLEKFIKNILQENIEYIDSVSRVIIFPSQGNDNSPPPRDG